MARKRVSSVSKKAARAKRAADALPKVRLPKTWRVVTSRKLPARKGDRANAPAREVPEIRIGGGWLTRVGFPKGTRYLVSADRSFETIYLQAAQTTVGRRRSRKRT